MIELADTVTSTVPAADAARRATVNPVRTRGDWEAMRAAALADPGKFHGDRARETLHWFVPSAGAWLNYADGVWSGWDATTAEAVTAALPADFTPWTTAFDASDAPFFKWFAGGLTNACFSEVDRHVLAGRGDEAALILLFKCEMKAAPGTHYDYSCLGYITLGKILERVAKEPLDAFAKREIFEPLGMSNSGFRRISTSPKLGAADNVAPTIASDRERGRLYGEVHDGNASGIDGVSGNAGLFSTASDMLRYGQMLLNGGELDGARILCPRTVDRMLHSQIDKAAGGQTWGLFCAPSGMHPGGDILWEGSAAHTGFTGTSLLVHKGLELVVVLLTNRVLIADSTHIRARRLFHNAVGAAIVD